MSQKYRDNLALLKPFKTAGILLAIDVAMANQLQAVETAYLALIEEIFAATATTELPDHERNWGLPDPCTGPLATIGERQLAFQLRKRSRTTGLSRQFFIDLAAQVGYVITIDETIVGEVYTWNVNLPYAEGIDWFEMGTGVMGDHLNSPDLQPLECLITRLKPRHTVVQFTYTP